MAGTGSSNRTKYHIRKGVLFAILLLPLWSYLYWLASPNTTLKVVMLDKTAQDFSNIEHRAFTWVLNHERYTKPDGSQYSKRLDYLGYFPKPTNLLDSKDLHGFSQAQIDSISDYVDVGYFIDTYGSYYQDWRDRMRDIPRTGLIYGGFEGEDASLMESLMDKKKLVLAEFSIFGSPTPKPVRERTENLLGVYFSGWVGRYWQQLDTIVSDEVPRWIPRLYQEQYGVEYDFSGPGIGFFHESGRLLLLSEDELNHIVPIMETNPDVAEKYGLDEYLRYPFWFEICTMNSTVESIAHFRIHPNERGKELMDSLDLPVTFPAVLVHPDWKTIYMAGDFTDNPVGITSSVFAGVQHVKPFMYDNQNPEDRKKFFWEWYRPFITGILAENFQE